MKNMQKELENDMLYLKEMLDLKEVLDQEEFCFEERRFDNNLFRGGACLSQICEDDICTTSASSARICALLS